MHIEIFTKPNIERIVVEYIFRHGNVVPLSVVFIMSINTPLSWIDGVNKCTIKIISVGHDMVF